MTRTFVFLLTILWYTTVGMTSEHLWDLAKNDILPELQVGSPEWKGKEVVLKHGAAFAIPNSVFPDQKNFTVQVTASLGELINQSNFTVMKKEGDEDDGFSFNLHYKEGKPHHQRVAVQVNKVYMNTRFLPSRPGLQANTPYTFTLTVSNGFASFYINDIPFQKCYMEMIPNDKPLWVGNLPHIKNTMPVVIHGVKVYGASFKYVSKKERPSEHPRGLMPGDGWALEVPKVAHPDWPKVLIYGDSISNGYKQALIPSLLKKNVYVYHCVHFIKNDVPKAALEEMASRYDFDVIVFNNGLHSLSWTPDVVPDQMVKDRMRELTLSLKKGAPKAKLYYLLTTPHTAAHPSSDEPVDGFGEHNHTVIRLNTLSAEVMKEEHVDVIDIYSIFAKHLDLANGDGFHWQMPAYRIMSEEIEKAVLSTLEK